ncbi:putative rmlC-like cupin domain superfamily, rmlC-like jelly roll protein [Dioscorea sansibarensis]
MEEKPKRSMVFVLVLSFLFFEAVKCLDSDHEFPSIGPLVNKESRKVLSSSDSGLISALDVLDRYKGLYHLQFITMEPGSLFLPVLLHADMVFYVHTGKGTVTWVGDDGTDSLDVKKGDIYKLDQGTVFYVHCHPDPTRERLRIHAIFDTQENFVAAYSNLSDLVRGFDDKVLRIGFQVSEEAIQTIKGVEKPSPIVPFKAPENESDGRSKNWDERLLKAIISSQRPLDMIYNKKKKKTSAFNLLTTKHDVENCNGWSVAVTSCDFKALRGSDIGVFMVNLTKGSMMGPHWNPRGTEIAIAIHGQGMVQVVCPSEMAGNEGIIKCQNERFKVKEGDVFIVPKFHPMAQISFNNDSFVFVGFSSNVKKNYPQFLAGKWSVFRTIRKEILAMSFNVGNETVEELWASQDDAVMLEY